MEVLKAYPHVITAIKNVSEKQGFKDFVIDDVTINEKGEGYSSLFFLVKIKDNASDKQLNFACKVAFAEDELREKMPVKTAFKNERHFYLDVLPLMRKFEQDRGMIESAEFVPKCFEASLENKQEMFILENLRTVGFETFDKKSYLDHDHISLIFKTYGRFHAFSFALRDQNPEQFKNLAKNFGNLHEELLFDKNNFFKQMLQESGNFIKGYLKPGEDDEVIEKIQKIYGDEITEIFKNLITESCEYSAILHGDCWSNNMMFRYEKTGNIKKVTDIRLIDWQVTRAGSPVCDLSYCFYTGASEKAIDNLDEYLKIYHDTFSKCLTQLGSDPEKLFSFKTLKEEWKKFAKFGMMIGIFMWKLKLSDKEQILDFTESDDINEVSAAMYKATFDEDRYISITRKILYHLYEMGVL